jgi:hypothetical protein
MKKIDKMREGFPPSLFLNYFRALSSEFFLSPTAKTNVGYSEPFLLRSSHRALQLTFLNMTEPFYTDFFFTPTAIDNVGYSNRAPSKTLLEPCKIEFKGKHILYFKNAAEPEIDLKRNIFIYFKYSLWYNYL